VGSRRLRELLPVLQLRSGDKLGRRLRRVTRQLGDVRELDVLSMVIDELGLSRPHEQRALGLVKTEVERARDAARNKLQGSGVAAEAQHVADKLAEVLKHLGHDRDHEDDRTWRWVLEARVARRATAFERAMDAAGSVYLPERLHAVRIALKKLRYGAELAAEAIGRPDRKTLQALKKAQGLLGRMHDLQVLIDRVRSVQAALAPPDLNRWRDLDRLIRTLERSCRKLHAHYVRDRSKFVELSGRLAARSADSRSRKAG
jgi:CHAD domain-containing protein